MSGVKAGARQVIFKVLTLFQWAVLLSALAIVLFYGWHWGRNVASVPVRNIRISTSYQHVTPEELQAVVTPFLKQGFFYVSLEPLHAAIERMTWVDKVSVRRVWPSTLMINIIEQRAVARWGNGGILNADGELFHPQERSLPKDLPLLVGPAEQHQPIFQHYQALQSMLTPNQMTILAVQVSARRSWQLQLDNHIVVELGRKDHRLRLQRFVRALPTLQKKRRGKIHAVDLRYPNGLAVS